jgi:hypothetical protein
VFIFHTHEILGRATSHILRARYACGVEAFVVSIRAHVFQPCMNLIGEALLSGGTDYYCRTLCM